MFRLINLLIYFITQPHVFIICIELKIVLVYCTYFFKDVGEN